MTTTKTHVTMQHPTGQRKRFRLVSVTKRTITVRIDGDEYAFDRRKGTPYRPCEWYMPTDELNEFAPQNEDAMRGDRSLHHG